MHSGIVAQRTAIALQELQRLTLELDGALALGVGPEFKSRGRTLAEHHMNTLETVVSFLQALSTQLLADVDTEPNFPGLSLDEDERLALIGAGITTTTEVANSTATELKESAGITAKRGRELIKAAQALMEG